jgi:hypothetical protein
MIEEGSTMYDLLFIDSNDRNSKSSDRIMRCTASPRRTGTIDPEYWEYFVIDLGIICAVCAMYPVSIISTTLIILRNNIFNFSFRHSYRMLLSEIDLRTGTVQQASCTVYLSEHSV